MTNPSDTPDPNSENDKNRYQRDERIRETPPSGDAIPEPTGLGAQPPPAPDDAAVSQGTPPPFEENSLSQSPTPGTPPPQGPPPPVGGQNPADRKLIAGLLGILLGGLGIHKFYLGYTQEGIIMLAVTLGIGLVGGSITCGLLTPVAIIMSIIGLIEGILYLTKSDEEFVATYITGRKPWF
jgi:TM2 domain-containing membrane protein YozV